MQRKYKKKGSVLTNAWASSMYSHVQCSSLSSVFRKTNLTFSTWWPCWQWNRIRHLVGTNIIKQWPSQQPGTAKEPRQNTSFSNNEPTSKTWEHVWRKAISSSCHFCYSTRWMCQDFTGNGLKAPAGLALFPEVLSPQLLAQISCQSRDSFPTTYSIPDVNWSPRFPLSAKDRTASKGLLLDFNHDHFKTEGTLPAEQPGFLPWLY